MTEVKEISLLVEGMKSYPKAIGALKEFQRQVVSTIRKAVVEELDGLSSVMGVALKQSDPADWVRPDRLSGSFDPDSIGLGVKIDRRSALGWSLYFYLWWLKDEANLCVSIELRDGKVAESVFSAFKKCSTSVMLGGHEVYVSGMIGPGNAGQIPGIMRKLISEYSELWAKAGCLDKFLKP